MKKLIYKDEVYCYKQYIHPEYIWVGSWVKVYKERDGWNIFSKYKKIGEMKNIKRADAKDPKSLIRIVDEYKEKSGEKVLVVKCSPEIEALYKN